MIQLYQLINGLFKVLNFALFARIILSWLPHNPRHPIIEMLYTITEPILAPFRNIIPPHKLGGLDLSPIFAFFVLDFIQSILISIIF